MIINPFLFPLSDNIAAKYIDTLTNNSNIPYHLFAKDSDINKNLIRDIDKILSLMQENNIELELYSLFFSIWGHLFSFLVKLPANEKHKPNHLVELQNMIKFIADNYGGKISLSQIAASGNVSKTSCNLIFKKFTNQSPCDFLTEYRLKKSIKLMQSTDSSLTQIAYEVGFGGHSYYSETFKETYGISPSAYKKILMDNQTNR